MSILSILKTSAEIAAGVDYSLIGKTVTKWTKSYLSK